MGSLSGLVAQVRSMFWKQRSGTKNWFLDILQDIRILFLVPFLCCYLKCSQNVPHVPDSAHQPISSYTLISSIRAIPMLFMEWLYRDQPWLQASANTFMKMLKRKSASFQMAHFLFLLSMDVDMDMDMDMSSLVRDGAPTLFVSRTDSVKREPGALLNPRWNDQPIYDKIISTLAKCSFGFSKALSAWSSTWTQSKFSSADWKVFNCQLHFM